MSDDEVVTSYVPPRYPFPHKNNNFFFKNDWKKNDERVIMKVKMLIKMNDSDQMKLFQKILKTK